MKKSIITFLLTAALCVTSLSGIAQTAASGNPAPTNAPLVITADDKDGDGLPNDVEKVYGTNPYAADTDGDGINDMQDSTPVFTVNLMTETSAEVLPVKIKDARVEDNVADDHLEITLTNKGNRELTGFDIYFVITDKLSNLEEGYYVKLDGFSVLPGKSATIHFDNETAQPGHYFGNMNGLYGTSANGLTFSISLHANGFAPMMFSVDKATGAAEVAD